MNSALKIFKNAKIAKKDVKQKFELKNRNLIEIINNFE
jgi:hypothetical protein